MPRSRPWLIAACLCLALADAAGAQAARSVFLEDLTWTELRDDLRAGRTTVIVPVGGTEQSGPHMALGKHNVRVKVLAGRIAEGLGNALVAPVIAYVPEGSIDPPAAHMRFAGTISIPEGAFETTLEYAARSFRGHGFRDIVLIGDHGGYQKSLLRVAAKLNREWAASPVRVHAVEEYYLAAAGSDFARALKREGFSAAEIGTHAGVADTSLMLAIDPRLVRSDRLRDATPLGPAEGVQGDPRRSSAAAGKSGVDLIVARTREAIEKDVQRR
jgi:creatinine amidohydrolase/Fe(II)-dependent formamide hydrolase-like protein